MNLQQIFVQAFTYLVGIGVFGTLLTLATRAAVSAEGKLTQQHALAAHCLQLATVEAYGIAQAVLRASPKDLGSALADVKAKLSEELAGLSPIALSAAKAIHGGSWYAQLDAVALAALQQAAADNGTTLPAAMGAATGLRAATGVRSGSVAPHGRRSGGLLLGMVLMVLALSGCSAPQIPGTPTDASATPTWVPGAIVSLTIAHVSLVGAEATESVTGLTGTDLADYDSGLRLADSGVVAALGHIENGADPCQLHADVGLLTSDFDQVAAILGRHNTPVPATVLTGAGRVVAVLALALPPCNADAGTTNAVMAAHIRATFAPAALVVPAHAEDPS